MKIIFVACVGQKLDNPTFARDLYQSQWFKKARAYAEREGDQWYILSARFGVVSPDQVIYPYDQTLNRMKKAERESWALRVYEWIRRNVDYDFEMIFLAGKLYRQPLVTWLDNDGYMVSVPMQGLGIGQQLSWLGGRKC